MVAVAFLLASRRPNADSASGRVHVWPVMAVVAMRSCALSVTPNNVPALSVSAHTSATSTSSRASGHTDKKTVFHGQRCTATDSEHGLLRCMRSEHCRVGDGNGRCVIGNKGHSRCIPHSAHALHSRRVECMDDECCTLSCTTCRQQLAGMVSQGTTHAQMHTPSTRQSTSLSRAAPTVRITSRWLPVPTASGESPTKTTFVHSTKPPSMVSNGAVDSAAVLGAGSAGTMTTSRCPDALAWRIVSPVSVYGCWGKW